MADGSLIREGRQCTDLVVKGLRKNQVPREELIRVFTGYDEPFLDRQRQIDGMD